MRNIIDRELEDLFIEFEELFIEDSNSEELKVIYKKIMKREKEVNDELDYMFSTHKQQSKVNTVYLGKVHNSIYSYVKQK